MKKAILGLWLLVLLGILNWLVYQKEEVLKNAQTVLLELAPVDPRSLIQGDFMVLRYRIADELSSELTSVERREDTMLLALDARNVASLVQSSFANAAPLVGAVPEGARTQRLKYHVINGRCSLGAESFMFEEGQADHFAKAKYGELKVQENGDSVLVGLRDENLNPL